MAILFDNQCINIQNSLEIRYTNTQLGLGEKKYAALNVLNINFFCYFGSPGNACIKDKTTAEEVGRLRRSTSCAVLGS